MSRQSGFTMVEILASISVLTIGLLGLMSGLASTSRIASDVTDLGTCRIAAQNVVQAIRREPLLDVPLVFGAGSSQSEFWCTQYGTVSFTEIEEAVVTGRIDVFDDESSIPDDFAALAPEFDLDGDGTIESGSTSDFKLLPVRITFEVPTTTDPISVEMHIILAENQGG